MKSFTLTRTQRNPFWLMSLPAGDYVVVEEDWNEGMITRVKVVLMGPEHPDHPARVGVWMPVETWARLAGEVH